MRHTGGFAILLTLVFCLGATAAWGQEPDEDEEEEEEVDSGKTFDEVSKGATRLDRDGVGGVLWSLNASCDSGSDLEQRQCKAIKTARAKRVAGKTFIVPGDATAFVVGAWDGKKKALPLALSGCVACAEPIAIGGKPFYVVSNKAAPTFKGAVAAAATIHETSRKFKSEEEALKWRTEVVPRLKTELVVTIAGENAKWKRDGKEGIAVAVVGFRVYDPCNGGIVCASPKSSKAPIDKVACGDAVVEGEPDDKKQPEVKPEKKLPEELTAAQIKETMKPVKAAADQCFATYGVAGDAKLHVTVAADGAVVSVEVKGDFAGTPTGTCLEDAVKATAFPKTQKSRQSFKYPIVLR
jgi:hypothetical protein